jgi:hypothetical protein
MASSFTTTIEGERVTINLFSLDEYEQSGGIYFDGGNGGGFSNLSDETVAEMGPIWDERQEINEHILNRNRDAARRDFVAALSIDFTDTSFNYGDEWTVLKANGLDEQGVWYDSVADYFLIRDWPADAPLAARVNVGR